VSERELCLVFFSTYIGLHCRRRCYPIKIISSIVSKSCWTSKTQDNFSDKVECLLGIKKNKEQASLRMRKEIKIKY
jgi:hypothetical protein